MNNPNNKKTIFLIVGAIIILGAIFFMSNRLIVKGDNTAGTKSRAQLAREEKEIKNNIKLYQPKVTNRTKEEGLDISAASAIVVDQKTNEVIYHKNPKEKRPPASIIKILTFAMALELFEENEYIEITQFASEQISNKINMKAGEKLRISDLLYGLMMISANDAAYAIADATDGGFDSFVKKSNQKTKLLGLTDTTMKNPAGLDDPEQISTAFDMATITRYALIKHPKIIDYAGKTKEHSVYATENNEPHWWFGHLSRMLKVYPGMVAAKTGYTDEAKSTYVGIAERNGRQLVVVLLGGTDANNDVQKLLDFGFAN